MKTKDYLSYFSSYLTSFIFVGLSYFYCSLIFSPKELGLYSLGLAIVSFGNLFFENGIKFSIIKHKKRLNNTSYSIIFGLSLVLLFTFITLLCVVILNYYQFEINDEVLFLIFYPISIWIFSPIISIITGEYERKTKINVLSFFESISIIIERFFPILIFILLKNHNFLFFILLGFISRLVRLLLLYKYNAHIFLRLNNIYKKNDEALYVFKESIIIGFSNLSSIVRDNLHIIFISIIGIAWVGYYSWSFTICLIISQIYVQIVSRLSLSLSVKYENYEDKKNFIISQVEVLVMILTPNVFLALIIIPEINHLIFQNKWNNSIIILYFLFFRLIPGTCLTPLGNLLLIKNSRIFFLSIWVWTILEFICALIFTYYFNNLGLAISMAITAWFGLLIFCFFTEINFLKILKILFFRKGLLSSLTIFITYFYLIDHTIYTAILFSFLILVINVLIEKKMIDFFKSLTNLFRKNNII